MSTDLGPGGGIVRVGPLGLTAAILVAAALPACSETGPRAPATATAALELTRADEGAPDGPAAWLDWRDVCGPDADRTDPGDVIRDATYYWLFTHAPPTRGAGEITRRAAAAPWTFQLRGPDGAAADVLLVGRLDPGGGCELSAFHASASAGPLSAADAVEAAEPPWSAATAPTAIGATGATGPAQVPLAALGPDQPCGASVWGTVLASVPGADGAPPRLRIVVEPRRLVADALTAVAVLTPSCAKTLDFAVGELSGPGTEAPDAVSCDWTFSHDRYVLRILDRCEGTLALPAKAPAGAYAARAAVKVAFGEATCAATVAADAVNAFEPLEVTAVARASCAREVSFRAAVTGGSGDFGYRWAIAGPAATTPPELTSARGTVVVPASAARPGDVYTGTVTVTDRRADLAGICVDSDRAGANPLAPVAVALVPEVAGGRCPAMTSDAVTYRARASGGTGAYDYAWTPGSCRGDTCTLDPRDGDLCATAEVAVTVDDLSVPGLPECGPADSETETYSKTTAVSATGP